MEVNNHKKVVKVDEYIITNPNILKHLSKYIEEVRICLGIPGENSIYCNEIVFKENTPEILIETLKKLNYQELLGKLKRCYNGKIQVLTVVTPYGAINTELYEREGLKKCVREICAEYGVPIKNLPPARTLEELVYNILEKIVLYKVKQSSL